MFGAGRAAAMAAAGRHMKRSTVVAGAAAATAAAAAASTAAAVAWCSASLDPEQARSLGRRWVEEEATPGYVPPSASWPPPTEQPARSQIPALSAASAACGGADGGGGECERITFSLAVALLGGAVYLSRSELGAAPPRLVNCTCDGNVANATLDAEGVATPAEGGALYLYSAGEVQVIGCEMSSNSATSGGAIACVAQTTLRLARSLLSRNSAHSSGGAIAREGWPAMPLRRRRPPAS